MTAHGLLHFLRQLLQGIVADISPLAGTAHTANQFISTERLGQTVSLHHKQHGLLNRGKAALARSTLAPATNRRSSIDHTRVDDAGLLIVTKRAIHGGPFTDVVTPVVYSPSISCDHRPSPPPFPLSWYCSLYLLHIRSWRLRCTASFSAS